MERHIPPAYRFAPTDEEIVTHYLYNKVHHKPLSTSAIKSCDLYGNENEWIKVFEHTGETSLYFFTELKKKNKRGFRVERETSCGTWKEQNNSKIFKYCGSKKQHIGSRRTFTFVPKKGSQVKRRWVMHEYRLDGVLLNARNDCVLCRIKMKKPLKSEGQCSSDDANGVVLNMNVNKMIPIMSSDDHHMNNMSKVQTLNITDRDNAEDLESIFVDDEADSDFSLGISLQDLDN